MAKRKLRLEIKQSDEDGESDTPGIPRWHSEHAITTNDITGSVTKILITDPRGKQISITIGNDGNIREINGEVQKGENGTLTDSENQKEVIPSNQDEISKSSDICDVNLDSIKTEIEEPAETRTESPFSFNNVMEVVSEGYVNPETFEPEVQAEFHTEMGEIKSEDSNLIGKFETVFIDSEMGSENYEILRPEEQTSGIFGALDDTNSSSLCRLCAVNSKDMIHIFKQSEAHANIIEKINDCLSVLVRTTDTLPQQVCRLCLNKVEQFYKFRKTVEDAEKKFSTTNKELSEESRTQEIYVQPLPISNEQLCAVEPTDKVLLLSKDISDSDTKQSSSICNKPSIGKITRTGDIMSVGHDITPRLNDEQIYEGDLLKCRICGMFFGTVKSCCMHAVAHYSENYYPCSLCESIFTAKIDMNKHMLKHTMRRYFRGREATANKMLPESGIRLSESTEKTVEETKNIENNILVNENNTIETEKSQVPSENQDLIKCNICGRYFGSPRTCYIHSKIHASEHHHPCGMCDKVFDNGKDNNTHSYEHIRRRTSRRKAVINRRKISNTGKQSTAITKANESLNPDGNTTEKKNDPADNLILNKEPAEGSTPLYRSDDQDLLKCKICGRYFGSPKTCYLHSKIHASKNYYPCSMCDKILGNETESVRHSYEHRRRRTFRRSVVKDRKNMSNTEQQSFAIITKANGSSNNVADINEQNDNPVNDLIIREEPAKSRIPVDQSDEQDMIKCRICGQYFGSARTCYRHSRTHASEKYHPCAMCDEVFTNEADGRRHSYVHSKYKYSQRSAVLKGKKIFNAEQQFFAIMNVKGTSNTSGDTTEKNNNPVDKYNFHKEEPAEGSTPADQSDDQDMIKCRICGRYFGSPRSCYIHAKTHASENHYPCSMCDEVFKIEADCITHSHEHIGNRVFQSRVAAAMYNRKNIPNNEGHPTLELDKLDRRTETHAYKIDGGYRIICRFCGVTFRNAGCCYSHSGAHTKDNYYPCIICHKAFTTEKDAYKHNLEHVLGKLIIRNISTHPCKECGKRFETEDRLHFHEIYHDVKMKPRYCKRCDKYLSSESSLYNHMMHFHNEFKKYNCNICGAQFGNKPQLAGHQAKHAVRPFECSLCKTKFFTQDKLELHQLNHCRSTLSIKKFSCHYCGKTFLRKWSLSNHVRNHMGERPFLCEFCPKSYATNQSRNKHQVSHAGQRRFKCSNCEDRFIDLRELEEHEKTHFGNEKLFECYICEESFKDEDTRKEHTRTIHIGDHPCDICGLRFMRATSLRLHKKTRHGGK